jgi:hypothetical protein
MERLMSWTLTIEVDGEERSYRFTDGSIARAVCDAYERADPPRRYRLSGPGEAGSNAPLDQAVEVA